MRLAIYAHPWDLRGLGARGGMARLRALGFDEIAVATAYHAGRWLTPWSTDGLVRFLEDGTVHFRPRGDYGRLVPLPSRDVERGGPSPLEAACGGSAAAGLRCVGWTVLFHNSRLGRANRELCVENALGDRYEYALCPAQSDVRDYGARLAADVARHPGLHGLELEAAGFYGFKHGSHHDKSSLGLDARTDFLLSFCFCPACRKELAAGGADADAARAAVAAHLRSWALAADALLPVARADALAQLRAELGATLLGALLDHRRRVQVQFLRTVRGTLPAGVRLAAHVVPDPLATGSSIGQRLSELVGAIDDAVLTFYGQGASDIAQACGQTFPAELGVHVAIWPKVPSFCSDADLVAVRNAAQAAGARSLRIYHLGLLPWRTIERVGVALRG